MAKPNKFIYTADDPVPVITTADMDKLGIKPIGDGQPDPTDEATGDTGSLSGVAELSEVIAAALEMAGGLDAPGMQAVIEQLASVKSSLDDVEATLAGGDDDQAASDAQAKRSSRADAAAQAAVKSRRAGG